MSRVEQPKVHRTAPRRTLLYDMTACFDHECGERENCLRYVGRNDAPSTRDGERGHRLQVHSLKSNWFCKEDACEAFMALR